MMQRQLPLFHLDFLVAVKAGGYHFTDVYHLYKYMHKHAITCYYNPIKMCQAFHLADIQP